MNAVSVFSLFLYCYSSLLSVKRGFGCCIFIRGFAALELQGVKCVSL